MRIKDKMKGKVEGRKELTGSRVSADGKVSSAMYTVYSRLHRILKGRDILRPRDERGNLLSRGVALCEIVRNVTPDAARIVAEAVTLGVLGYRNVAHDKQGSVRVI